MEDFQFRPSFIQLPAFTSFDGEIRLPGSKSITNRAFLIAALAEGRTRLHNLLKSDDTRYMGEALRKLGVHIDFSDDFSEAVVEGSGKPISLDGAVDLFLGNAGTAMRSLTAALSLGKGQFTLTGEERMSERPIRDLVDALHSRHFHLPSFLVDDHSACGSEEGFQVAHRFPCFADEHTMRRC